MRPIHLMVLVVCPGAAFAKTPDEVTPSVEPVCNEYRGTLRGQCVSYCEARDCDDARKRAADPSCAESEENFIALTGSGFPCPSFGAVCTMDAQDDEVYFNDAGTISFNVLVNDAADPTPSDATVTSAVPNASVTVNNLAAGAFTATWDGRGAISQSFAYPACCDASTSQCAWPLFRSSRAARRMCWSPPTSRRRASTSPIFST